MMVDNQNGAGLLLLSRFDKDQRLCRVEWVGIQRPSPSNTLLLTAYGIGTLESLEYGVGYQENYGAEWRSMYCLYHIGLLENTRELLCISFIFAGHGRFYHGLKDKERSLFKITPRSQCLGM